MEYCLFPARRIYFAFVFLIVQSSFYLSLSAHEITPTQYIDVKLYNNESLELLQDFLLSKSNDLEIYIEPAFSMERDKIDQLRSKASKYASEELPDLNLWFRISVPLSVDADELIGELNQLEYIRNVEIMHHPILHFEAFKVTALSQPYLDNLNVKAAWAIPGGNGSNVKIYDVEGNWGPGQIPGTDRTNTYYTGPPIHIDLTKAQNADVLFRTDFRTFDGSPDIEGCRQENEPFGRQSAHHGTSVLGVLFADNDEKGVTGISWGAGVGLATTKCDGVANAILRAADDGMPGDVILIEAQQRVCGNTAVGLSQSGLGPYEWGLPTFEATEIAVNSGLVVVAAAGNGSVDLDSPGCEGRFDRNLRDSGAIIVGGGLPPGSVRIVWRVLEIPPPAEGLPGFRREFPLLVPAFGYADGSSYGSRVDIQGWYTNVTTTGGGPFGSFDELKDGYVDFSGTSAASPMIAGIAANLQSIAIEHYGRSLTPHYLRDLLVKTGKFPIGHDQSKHIGPLPDVAQAIDQLFLDIPLCGDMNGDKAITQTDIRQAQRTAEICQRASSNPDVACIMGRCDVDSDSLCTENDVDLIREASKTSSRRNLICNSNLLYVSPS